MNLTPSPISNNEYHDAWLRGIFVEHDRIILGTSCEVGGDILIIASSVKWFLASDVLRGNIIQYIGIYDVTEDNALSVMESFKLSGSEYFDGSVGLDIVETGGLVGLKFLAVVPSYGASVLMLCEKVEERRGSIGVSETID